MLEVFGKNNSVEYRSDKAYYFENSNHKETLYILKNLVERLSHPNRWTKDKSLIEIEMHSADIEALLDATTAVQMLVDSMKLPDLDEVYCPECNSYTVTTNDKEKEYVKDDEGSIIGERIITGFRSYCPVCGWTGSLYKSQKECKSKLKLTNSIEAEMKYEFKED